MLRPLLSTHTSLQHYPRTPPLPLSNPTHAPQRGHKTPPKPHNTYQRFPAHQYRFREGPLCNPPTTRPTPVTLPALTLSVRERVPRVPLPPLSAADRRGDWDAYGDFIKHMSHRESKRVKLGGDPGRGGRSGMSPTEWQVTDGTERNENDLADQPRKKNCIKRLSLGRKKMMKKKKTAQNVGVKDCGGG